MTIYYQDIPAIDNPNTLLENVRKSRTLNSDTQIRDWVNSNDLGTINQVTNSRDDSNDPATS